MPRRVASSPPSQPVSQSAGGTAIPGRDCGRAEPINRRDKEQPSFIRGVCVYAISCLPQKRWGSFSTLEYVRTRLRSRPGRNPVPHHWSNVICCAHNRQTHHHIVPLHLGFFTCQLLALQLQSGIGIMENLIEFLYSMRGS